MGILVPKVGKKLKLKLLKYQTFSFLPESLFCLIIVIFICYSVSHICNSFAIQYQAWDYALGECRSSQSSQSLSYGLAHAAYLLLGFSSCQSGLGTSTSTSHLPLHQPIIDEQHPREYNRYTGTHQDQGQVSGSPLLRHPLNTLYCQSRVGTATAMSPPSTSLLSCPHSGPHYRQRAIVVAEVGRKQRPCGAQSALVVGCSRLSLIGGREEDAK